MRLGQAVLRIIAWLRPVRRSGTRIGEKPPDAHKDDEEHNGNKNNGACFSHNVLLETERAHNAVQKIGELGLVKRLEAVLRRIVRDL